MLDFILRLGYARDRERHSGPVHLGQILADKLSHPGLLEGPVEQALGLSWGYGKGPDIEKHSPGPDRLGKIMAGRKSIYGLTRAWPVLGA